MNRDYPSHYVERDLVRTDYGFPSSLARLGAKPRARTELASAYGEQFPDRLSGRVAFARQFCFLLGSLNVVYEILFGSQNGEVAFHPAGMPVSVATKDAILSTCSSNVSQLQALFRPIPD